MPEIEIRSVRPEDIESLSAIEHGYYSEYVWQMNLERDPGAAEVDFRRIRLPRRVFVPYPRKREEIFTEIEQAEDCLVAGLNGRLVGYIKVQAEVETQVARISDVVISAPLRRQGIASGLLFAVMDHVAQRHLHTLILEMQLKNNPAIEMANKLGFIFCGFRDHYFPNQDTALFFSRYTR